MKAISPQAPALGLASRPSFTLLSLPPSHMPPSQEIPVYCIDRFQLTQAPAHAGFDIKAVEKLVAEFSFANLPHKHDFYNVLFITKGSGTHTIDFVTYEIKPGSVFFLTPGQVHSWELSPDIEGFSVFLEAAFYLVGRPEQTLRNLPFFHAFHSQPVVYLDRESQQKMGLMMEEMRAEFQGEEPRRFEVIRAILEVFLLKMTRYYQAGEVMPRPDGQSAYLLGQVHQFETLIDEHFRQVKAVKDYADRLNLTPKNLNNICKKTINKTASDLIYERIVLEARRLLLHSDMTVQQIVLELDFYDASYFVKFFKKHTGQTPEQYRKQ